MIKWVENSLGYRLSHELVFLIIAINAANIGQDSYFNVKLPCIKLHFGSFSRNSFTATQMNSTQNPSPSIPYGTASCVTLRLILLQIYSDLHFCFLSNKRKKGDVDLQPNVEMFYTTCVSTFSTISEFLYELYTF